MILFLLSLLAGVLTVLAPCTISLLPVIVGGSLSGDRSIRRAVVVTTSLGASVVLFTLLLKVSTAFIMVPQSFWQVFSGVVIIFLGLTYLFPAIWDNLPFINRVSRESNKVMSEGYMKQTFLGDMLVGAALGPVFSSCSPTYFLIIATVLPRSFAAGLVYLLAYAVGLCVTLLVVAIAGQKLLDRFGVASDPKGVFKRVIGVLFLLVGAAIALGLDAKLELIAANTGFLNAGVLEQQFLPQSNGGPTISPGAGYVATSSSPEQISTSTTKAAKPDAAARIAAKAKVYAKAPEIAKAAGYLNTGGKPITIAGQKGKVVLIDFWAYSCINCQREIPYVVAWYNKYKSEGLEIIGVHTPEFAFEKVSANVANAAKEMHVAFPIVLDNSYGTWDAFGNQYWPQVYLIDSDGFVVYSHSGEGNYQETEAAIQKALKERAANEAIDMAVSSGTVVPVGAEEANLFAIGSPETYFGYDRNRYLANGTQGRAGVQTLTIPTAIDLNQLYLGGTWNFTPEYAETSDPTASIRYEFRSQNVYMVAAGSQTATVRVLLDGKPIGTNAGDGVLKDGTMVVSADKLYKLVHLETPGIHTLEIQLMSGTLDAYTFTFG